MKSTKKTIALMIFVIVSLGTFISAVGAETLRTTAWTGAVTAFYSDDAPEGYGGMGIDTKTIRVGKTAGGGDIFSFVRVPLGVDFFADEITEAKLFLYAAEGAPPKELRIGTVSGRWTLYISTCAEAKALADNNGLTVTALQPEDDGWVSVSVTEIVQAWTRADTQNFGFALFPLAGEAQGVFADMYHSDGNAPYLKVSGRVGKRPSGYGKFGFTRVPEEGRLDDTVNANCLAYAVRDSVPVHLDDLGGSYRDVNRVFLESGEDGVVEYIGGLFEKYVEEHKAGLRVSKLRRIDGFNASIDPAKEYRIALRLGCYAKEDEPLSEDARNFDFHFWAQLADGRWSQKYAGNYSEIIPATGPGVSPGKYYWEMAKYGYLYRSKVIYYAVTKDTDEMTVHRPCPFADVGLYDYINNGVEYVFKNGLMIGTSAAPMLFDPDTAMTRGMAATAFYRMAGSPDAGVFSNPFDDVGAGTWYCDAVKWAAANGIIFDCNGDGKFAPDRKITREEAAAAFFNYQRLSGVIPPDILLEMEPGDADEISEWAREAAKKLMMQMIFRGTGDFFIPKGEITRIEFAGMLRDYCEDSNR
ncbi:MAG: S-layer homology domain-containing protein [Firmicutes bacterium]|nr:S-layer homology domain-containing protein [Bacillota bacterium]